MNYEQIKHRLAPCGLHCGKCFTYKGGDIEQYSQQLKDSLGQFDIYAKRFVELTGEQVFLKYPDFKEMLQYFSEAQCGGCRIEKCKFFKGCNVRVCTEKMNVDFCFECPDFPCNKTGFDKHLYERSVAINRRMKEIGIVAYYNEIKDKPRY